MSDCTTKPEDIKNCPGCSRKPKYWDMSPFADVWMTRVECNCALGRKLGHMYASEWNEIFQRGE